MVPVRSLVITRSHFSVLALGLVTSSDSNARSAVLSFWLWHAAQYLSRTAREAAAGDAACNEATAATLPRRSAKSFIWLTRYHRPAPLVNEQPSKQYFCRTPAAPHRRHTVMKRRKFLGRSMAGGIAFGLAGARGGQAPSASRSD